MAESRRLLDGPLGSTSTNGEFRKLIEALKDLTSGLIGTQLR